MVAAAGERKKKQVVEGLKAEIDAAYLEPRLTVKELAELLRVSTQTIYRWFWAGKLPADRATGYNSRLLFRVSEVRKLVLPSQRRAKPRRASDGTQGKAKRKRSAG